MSFAPVGFGAFEQTLDVASSIAVAAYVLESRGPLVRDLESAAARGARVHVTLAGAAAGGISADGLRAANAATAHELREHGVAVAFADAAAPFHLKAAVVDGRAYLDDRNWASGDTVLETADPDCVAAVVAAIGGEPRSTAALALTKRDALEREAGAIRTATGDHIDVASESFGSSPVSSALAARAKAGDHIRLVVTQSALRHASAAELAALGRLAAAGVAVRSGPSTDKVCVAGSTAWLGSANATFWPPSMLDWGLTSAAPALVALASQTFASAWQRARPVTAAELRVLSG